MKTKQDFLAKVQVGSLIAFRIGEDVYSGKVIEVRPAQFIVRTKSCSIFFVEKMVLFWFNICCVEVFSESFANYWISCNA